VDRQDVVFCSVADTVGEFGRDVEGSGFHFAGFPTLSISGLLDRLDQFANSIRCYSHPHPEVPSDNNHGERQIRPAVIARKNSYANGSEEGAETQAVLMSVFRTLKQRGHNPISAVVDAVRVHLQTGQLPPLPGPIAENG
jgi:transposase